MADTTALKNRIRAAIKANDNQEITGPILQQSLLDIVDELNNGTETEASTRSNADAILQQNITTEKNRAEEAESTLQQNIIAEKNRAEEAESTLQQNITTEKNRAEEAESILQQNITTEKNRAKEAESTLQHNYKANIDDCKKGRINTSGLQVGDVINLNVYDDSVNTIWRHIILPVHKNDTVYVTGLSTTSSAIYTIADSTNHVIEIHAVNNGKYINEIDITDGNAAKIIVNFSVTDALTDNIEFGSVSKAGAFEKLSRLRHLNPCFDTFAIAQGDAPTIEFTNRNNNTCDIVINGRFRSLFNGSYSECVDTTIQDVDYRYGAIALVETIVPEEYGIRNTITLEYVNAIVGSTTDYDTVAMGITRNKSMNKSYHILAYWVYGKIYWTCQTDAGTADERSIKIVNDIRKEFAAKTTIEKTWEYVAGTPYTIAFGRTVKKGEIIDITVTSSESNLLVLAVYNNELGSIGFRHDYMFDNGVSRRCRFVVPYDMTYMNFNSTGTFQVTLNAKIEIYPYRNNTDFIVAADGSGDYTSIYDALFNIGDCLNTNTYKNYAATVLVKPGTYVCPELTTANWGNKSNDRNISIIGENIDKCVLKNTRGNYNYEIPIDNACIKLSGNVTIQNLTIKSTDEDYDSTVEGARDMAYCIHVDSAATTDSIIRINNCKLTNNHFACIGFGINPKQTLIIENCDMTSTFNTNHSTDYGTIHGHDRGGVGDENLQIRNCIIRNTNYPKAITIGDNFQHGIMAEFVNNTSNVDVVRFNRVTLSATSFGNSIDDLNSN